MKFLALLFLAATLPVLAQSTMEITDAKQRALLGEASKHFSQGRYQTTAEELEKIDKTLAVGNGNTPDKQLMGLVAYWKGIVYSRLQEYPLANENFNRALKLGYSPLDINYEYGQSLYASEKLDLARVQFRESLKKKFKMAISLYYIGFLTKELGQNDKALAFFKGMEKLPKEETKGIQQAVDFQIGDIYLEQTEKHKDAFRAVEKFVIPQYEKAIGVDKESALAPRIKEKIVALQRKYDLVLFNMRNGRPTLIPPYFIRAAQEIGIDTNVTFAPNDTTVSKSHQSSTYSKTDVMGKYTFYIGDFMSIAPEFRFNNVYYFNRVKEIYRNDNQLYAPALRTAFEHTLFNKQAATLLDYDFNEALRDVNARQRLDFSSRAHTFMLGERFNFFQSGETILRVKHRTFNSYVDSQNAQAWSFVVEQTKSLGSNTLLFYGSLDRNRVAANVFDTNAMTLRADFIMGKVRDWFSPSAGFSMTRTDPIHDRSARGQETQVNPNLRLYKTFGRIRTAFKYDYMRNFSRNESAFAYKKQTYALELEYIF